MKFDKTIDPSDLPTSLKIVKVKMKEIDRFILWSVKEENLNESNVEKLK